MSEAVRKMQLVEVGELERLQQRQVKEYDPTLNAMARAQFELETILSNKNLSDEDKLALLSHAQLKFKKLKASMGSMGNSDISVPTPPAPAPPAPAPAPSSPIVEDVDDPLKLFLDKHPNVIRSNAAGQLVFQNISVPGSSFEQIMQDAESGANFSQPGFREFIQGLRMLHPPRNLIKSESLQNAYESGSKKSAPHRSSFKSSPPIKLPPLDDEDDKVLSSMMTPKGKTRKSQKGKGIAAPPPGKRPRILFLYK